MILKVTVSREIFMTNMASVRAVLGMYGFRVPREVAAVVEAEPAGVAAEPLDALVRP